MHSLKYEDYSDADMEDGGGHSSSSTYRKRPSRRTHALYDVDYSSDDSSPKPSRKRMRAEPRRREVPVPSVASKQVQLGDTEALRAFYERCLKDMQQSGCKVLGKAWVKLLEPKKQSTYPYTKGTEGAPLWWPLRHPVTNVRHKEPDHLHKSGMSCHASYLLISY
jgi:hypothetical protein